MKRLPAACLPMLPAQAAPAQNAPRATNMERDFWVIFLPNTGGYHQLPTDSCTLLAVGPAAAEVTVVSSDDSAVFHLAAGATAEHLCGTNAEVRGKAYHVTSTAPIALFARNAVDGSHEVAMIVPTPCLGTKYMAQSATAAQGDREMLGFVATEDSTVITVDFSDMHFHEPPPDDIGLPSDRLLRIPLQRGETYILGTQQSLGNNTDSHGHFGGRPVTSNGRPFALFQGNSAAHVPVTDPYNGTHLYEQAVPLSQWGHLCIASGIGEQDLYFGDIYSAGENELILHAGDTDQVVGYMSTGEVDHYENRPSDYGGLLPRIYYYTQGASSYLLLSSYGASGFKGGAASVMLPALDHGVQEAWFTAQEYDPQQENHLTIFCDTSVAPGLRLDGQPLPLPSAFPSGMQPQLHNVHPYCTTVENGPHRLEADSGVFIAILYGLRPGYSDSYANSVGMALAPYPRDTLERTDTVCAYSPYSWGPFHWADGELTEAGTLELEQKQFAPDTIHLCRLHLTVLAAVRREERHTLVPGDTLAVEDTLLATPGTYTFRHGMESGCDSVLTVVIDFCTAPPPCVETSRPFFDTDHPVVVFTDCTEGGHTAVWHFSDGVTLTGRQVRRQLHPPLPDSLGVTLTVCDDTGCCADTAFSLPSKTLTVWFPNVFTPDAEENNRFGCKTTVEAENYTLSIYNRHGQLLFSTTDPAAAWDGSHNGRPCPQGTYVYHFSITDPYGFRQSGTATVTLLR